MILFFGLWWVLFNVVFLATIIALEMLGAYEKFD